MNSDEIAKLSEGETEFGSAGERDEIERKVDNFESAGA